MYIAFQRRWKLQDEDGRMASIHWRQPSSDSVRDEANALVWIARIGDHIAKMRWVALNNGSDALTLKSYKDLSFSVRREQAFEETMEGDDGEGTYHLRTNVDNLFPVTLHIVDVERCQVMTVMENAPPHEVHVGPDPYGEGDAIDTNGHGTCNRHSTMLFGFPTDMTPEVNWEYLQQQPAEVEALLVDGFITLQSVGLINNTNVFKSLYSGALRFFFDHDRICTVHGRGL